MKLRKIENTIDNVLWGVFISLAGYIIWFAYSNRAPSFEPFSTDIVYGYTDNNGLKSEYQFAWHHPQYKELYIPLWPLKSELVVYDPKNGNYATLTEEYKAGYLTIMPASQIAYWRHWTTLIAIILIIASAFFVYWCGGLIREYLLFSIVKKRNTFPAYAYFLYEDRIIYKKQACAKVKQTIDSYINKCNELFNQKYSKEFSNLLINLLYKIKYSGDTKLSFYYTHVNNAVKHDDYLRDLSSYWTKQIGTDPEAQQKRDYCDSLRANKYVELYQGNEGAPSDTVTKILKELFTEVFGEEIINFEAHPSHYAIARKQSNAIFVKTIAQNTLDNFTWSGTEYPNQYFPGLAIQFTIYYYENDKEISLWNRFLSPKCTYKAEFLNVEDLYKNMISETISSFSESLTEGYSPPTAQNPTAQKIDSKNKGKTSHKKRAILFLCGIAVLVASIIFIPPLFLNKNSQSLLIDEIDEINTSVIPGTYKVKQKTSGNESMQMYADIEETEHNTFSITVHHDFGVQSYVFKISPDGSLSSDELGSGTFTYKEKFNKTTIVFTDKNSMVWEFIK